ncbi:hypothetical protein [Tranquillimonas rosea]|uniref:hypothetical protein n=1 Tax=Tranquillimonas rosea TaxID=641238 RepID=UPI003BA861B7
MKLHLLIPTLAALATGLSALTGVAAPQDEAPSLRTLAEIDGDPDTFTDAEREKMDVLARVLGTDPSAAPARPAALDAPSRSANETALEGL